MMYVNDSRKTLTGELHCSVRVLALCPAQHCADPPEVEKVGDWLGLGDRQSQGPRLVQQPRRGVGSKGGTSSELGWGLGGRGRHAEL